jgi:hypothetical protein
LQAPCGSLDLGLRYRARSSAPVGPRERFQTFQISVKARFERIADRLAEQASRMQAEQRGDEGLRTG